MNRIRQALTEGRVSFGAWSTLAGSQAAELMGGAGFDWVIIDAQHGALTTSDLLPMIQALQLGGTAAVVRVPWTDAATIMRVLDFGATGVIVPMVSTPEEASLAASAMRYPPAGIRSFGPTRGAFPSTSQANDEVVLLVMIETAEGLERVDEIAATPGVDGLFLGPVDLGLSLGQPLDWTGTDSVVAEATDKVVAAAARAGRFVGTVSFGPDQARDLVRRGIRFLTLGADAGYIRAGIAQDRALMESLKAVTGDVDT
ncbi:MAG TPA: aldolase/citrate lyase family protein [Acidimicrobiales bacterium]|nr:aldolase/citrate lyase family protein [Acidimicrobiales bacterium]